MSILIGKNTRVLVQGMTGREGRTAAEQMIAYGTDVVGGVTPYKGGEWGVRGRPVFDSVRSAVNATEANASLITVAAPQAVDAIYEAVDAGIGLIACITEGIPMLDMMRLIDVLRTTSTRLIGANSPGLLAPEQSSLGIVPGYITRRGSIGIVSRSSSLMYEIAYGLTIRGFGQSTLVGIGGDPVIGTTFVDILDLFEEDLETEQIILIGEIGGDLEQQAADFIKTRMTKPVYGLVVGHSAPHRVRMGHAGASIERAEETAAAKVSALRAAGVRTADTLAELFALF
ncbi:MAG: succinate--CoA ligase subunit alpha [bacterium]|nr:succinate--CoA ligase subunit alpha [bacterium]